MMCLSLCLEKSPFRSQLGRTALEAEIIMLVELNLSGLHVATVFLVK